MEKANIIVYCTVPDEGTGRGIAECIVKERLCACVSRIRGVTSHYVFDGSYCEDHEELLMIKSTAEAFERLKKHLEALHPYDVPEIIATPLSAGNEAYLQWLESSVR